MLELRDTPPKNPLEYTNPSSLKPHPAFGTEIFFFQILPTTNNKMLSGLAYERFMRMRVITYP